jgi:hypothetical protein
MRVFTWLLSEPFLEPFLSACISSLVRFGASKGTVLIPRRHVRVDVQLQVRAECGVSCTLNLMVRAWHV